MANWTALLILTEISAWTQIVTLTAKMANTGNMPATDADFVDIDTLGKLDLPSLPVLKSEKD